jgi:RNA polymerase sigma-70 factor (ECF subfamily)
VIPLIEKIIDAGPIAWPDVKIDPAQVRAYWEPRIQGLAEQSISWPADLYLACACLSGNPQAVRHLEALCRAGLDFALRRLKIAADLGPLAANLLSKLLVAESGSPPKLGSYAGRSELLRWIQAVALRQVVDERRLFLRDKLLHEALLDEIVAQGLPEWKSMDLAGRHAFREALKRALGGLMGRDRTLLRLRLEGLSLAEIAERFEVRHNTVSRWLMRVGVVVEHAVRRELREGLKLPSSEIDSLVRSALSRVDTSLRREVTRACGDQ